MAEKIESFTLGKPEREQLASRIGFLAMSAGCAIGLGNVWRFPYITGQYGGAIFVLIYLVFLVLIGYPVMVAELALGRASQSDLPGALNKLASQGKKNLWPVGGYIAFAGNAILLMFYSVVSGWMFAYCWKFLVHAFPKEVEAGPYFGQFLSSWQELLLFMLIAVIITTVICIGGVQRGIEKAMRIMLGGLFVLQLVLIGFLLCRPGAMQGVKFFLAPDFSKITLNTLWPAVHAAMMQAFFTLSLGIGSIAICGSYIKKTNSLGSEASWIIVLDTLAAILAGLIIFPACFAYNVQPNQGPALIFVTLTKVFQNMTGGYFLGTLFFLFLSVAALSTLVAVGENLIACMMRSWNMSRVKASLIFCFGMIVLSLPCLFGFNLLSKWQPMGKGTCVLDLEDFILSDNLLPLGAVMILFFCTRKCGWGLDKFLTEVNTGKGMRFPHLLALYTKYILPLAILVLWGHNICTKFFFK